MSTLKFSRNPRRKGAFATLLMAAILCLELIAFSSEAEARPRSGGSFGGRSFRNSGGYRTAPRTGYGQGQGYGGVSRPTFFFFPGFGWGGAGYGGGGFGIGSLLVLGVLGVAAYSVFRAVRRHRDAGGEGWGWGRQDDDQESEAMAGRAYVYRMQVALGRSARGIQDRMARFAAEGNTNTEEGLATLLQQTALELMREKDSIRAAAVEGSGPMSLTNAETKMNGLALAERARFQVERVRGADGHVRRSEVAAEEGKEALEYVVVTLVVATRTPLGKEWGKGEITSHQELDTYLGQLGGVAGAGLLGLEAVWTPADPNDSLTQTDLMTTYPDLRSL